MNDDTALAASFLHCLHEREAQRDDPSAVERFGQAYQALRTFARQADRAAQDRLLRALTDGFPATQSNWEFGCLANTCGEIVEWGGDAGIAVEPILERISKQFARVPEFVQVMQEHLDVKDANAVAEADWRTLGEEHPHHAWVIGEWYALRFTGCAAMTMLCRDVESRKRARDQIELRQRAEAASDASPFAYYLAELLAMIDDERLLVLDMSRRLGYRVRLVAVRNNFHLFTLLQAALLAHPTAQDWRGPRVRPLVVAVAKGERLLHDIAPNEWAAEDPDNAQHVHDSAIWTYYTWRALKLDGSLLTQQESSGQLPPWVWGEGKPTEIPELDGERVVLLGPLEIPRSWNLGFFTPLHSALRSAVVIETVLSGDEIQAWADKIHDHV